MRESARGEPPQGARCLRPDEPLTDQRRRDHEAEIGTLPMRDVEPEWRNFVDDRIARSVLYASSGAVDADWRKWVRRENVIQAKARVKAQNDTGPASQAEPDPKAAAYAAGISSGKGAPWVWPGGKYADADLAKIIAGHAKDPNGKAYKGDQLLRFIESTAADFAADVLERGEAAYYSAFEPRGCLKWLNEAVLAEEARRVG